MPRSGWVCFHCGEHFGNPNLARAHFGATPDRKPACVLIQERGMLYELRAAEERAELAETAARIADDRLEAMEQEIAEYRRIAGGGVHELRMKIDSLEGFACVANRIVTELLERNEKLYKEIIG